MTLKKIDNTARQNILDAALQLFADKSYEGASTREIAQRAGVTQPLLAYHFSNKDALWRATVDMLFGKLTSVLVRRTKGLAGVDDLTTSKLLVREFIEFCAHHPQLLQIITGECKTESDRMDWLVEKHIRPLYEATVELHEKLSKAGHLTKISPTNFYYFLIGAGATMFALGAECRRLTGIDPSSPEVINDHVNSVITLLFGTAAEK